MGRDKIIRYLIFASLILVFLSCNRYDKGNILYGLEDLQNSNIAILDNSICTSDFCERFPDAKSTHFASSSEFLLSMAIGKCDAGIAEKKEGRYLINNSTDYVAFMDDAANKDSVIVIVHKRILPGRNAHERKGDFLEQSINRVDRSIISNNYWKLLLKGLCVTFVIFFFGIILALALAILMTWANATNGLKWISRPVSYFIRAIHDVPSVVLIFFFYYIVFASVQISGIIICIIALGIYSSGSFMNIFTVHLNQISITQHHAAHMLGLHGWQKYKYVILPQAVKPMLPLLAAESKVLLRATSYAGFISQLDLIKVTEIIRNQTYDVLVPLIFVSIIFLIISQLIVDTLSLLYKKAFNHD